MLGTTLHSCLSYPVGRIGRSVRRRRGGGVGEVGGCREVGELEVQYLEVYSRRCRLQREGRGQVEVEELVRREQEILAAINGYLGTGR